MTGAAKPRRSIRTLIRSRHYANFTRSLSRENLRNKKGLQFSIIVVYITLSSSASVRAASFACGRLRSRSNAGRRSFIKVSDAFDTADILFECKVQALSAVRVKVFADSDGTLKLKTNLGTLVEVASATRADVARTENSLAQFKTDLTLEFSLNQT